MARLGVARHSHGGSGEVLGDLRADTCQPRNANWCPAPSGGVDGVQGHLSGLSEGLFLRVSTVGFTVWLTWTAWEFARRNEPAPTQDVRS